MTNLIGITGGIGTGKTSVCHIFNNFGVPFLDADHIVQSLLTEKNTINEIKKCFGSQSVNPDSTINKYFLKQSIFNSVEKKKELESILHPKVRAEILSWMNAFKNGHKQSEHNYQIVCIPLLVENNWQSMFDRVLVVDIEEEIQIKRVMKRDHLNRDIVEKIISSQASRQAKLNAADDVITNDKDLKHLENQIKKLHEQYKNLSN